MQQTSPLDVSQLGVNPSYTEKTCIYNKNDDCALDRMCRKTPLNKLNNSKLAKTCYCKQKCICSKFKHKRDCDVYNIQNKIYKNMEYDSEKYYKDNLEQKLIKNPSLSKFPISKYDYNNLRWQYYNQKWYSMWFRRFANQNGPTVDGWPATQLTGDNGHIPYNVNKDIKNIYKHIQKNGDIGFYNTGCCYKKYPDYLTGLNKCTNPGRCYCKCNQVWKSASRKRYR